MTDALIELNDEGVRKKELILRNIQEALGEERLTRQISNGKALHIYWGTATTGRPHVGYFVPMQKIVDFLHAGVKVTILFADLHALLDNLKSTHDLLENRVLYYEQVIKALLTTLKVPIDQLHFVKGTSYQLGAAYTKDLLRLSTRVSHRDAHRAGAEVVKQVENPLLSGLLYPLLQALDEHHLQVDGQAGGVDQRKIFILAEEQLPKLKLRKRFHLMNPMVPGLTGTKMSSSEENTKIDLLDPPEVVSRKIESALCPRKKSGQENGVLAFFKYVVLPIRCHDAEQLLLTIGNRPFLDYASIEDAFEAGELTEESLKQYLKEFLNGVLEGVQAQCNTDEMRGIIEKAYPAVEEEKEPEVEGMPKMKNTGDKRYKIVWRCPIKGRVNLAHITALLQLKAMLETGCECEILLSDLGAFLDEEKCPWNALEGRSKYYERMLRECMDAIGGLQDVRITHSREQQFSEEYTLNLYKAASKVTRNETAAVISNSANLGGSLMPLYFALDMHYAGADGMLVGDYQHALFQLIQQILMRLELPNVCAIHLPRLVGINADRMSASAPDSHIEPFDTAKQVRQKVSKSFCEPKNPKDNVPLQLAEKVIFRLAGGEPVPIERTPENGGPLQVKDFEQLSALFVSGELHPADLKEMVSREINKLFDPIRSKFTAQQQTELLQSAQLIGGGGKGGAKKK